MKSGIHAENNRKVIFKDATSGELFLVYSSVETTEKAKWKDGKEYDLYETEISSASHPFYTGKEMSLDRAGRAEKFRARLEKKQTIKNNKTEVQPKEPIKETEVEIETEE